jgi:SAM-dependent MidA family methyltransferase
VPAFVAAARLGLVETSPRLRAKQAATLAGGPLAPVWYGSDEEIPAGPLIAVANEFFDALPIRQFERDGALWRERMVGLSEAGDLVFGLGPTAIGDADLPERLGLADQGAIVEVSPIGVSIMRRLATRIAASGGMLLAIDYGFSGPAFGDTFQAVRSHSSVDVLDRPGEADLTAHVDFTALAVAARAGGASVHGIAEQGDFLLALGLAERAGRLGADKDEAVRADIVGQVERLVGAQEMGSLFKVLAVSRPGVTLPGLTPWSPVEEPARS